MLQRKSPDILLLLLNVTLQLKSLDFLDGQIELSCLPGLTWVWTDGFMLNSEIEVHAQFVDKRTTLKPCSDLMKAQSWVQFWTLLEKSEKLAGTHYLGHCRAKGRCLPPHIEEKTSFKYNSWPLFSFKKAFKAANLIMNILSDDMVEYVHVFGLLGFSESNALSSSKCPQHQIPKLSFSVENAKKIQCIGKASIVNNTLLVEIWNQVWWH